MTPRSARSDVRLVGRLMGLMRPYRLHVAAFLILGLLAAPLAMLTPLPLKIAVDSALGTHPLPRMLRLEHVKPSSESALWVAVGLLVAIALLKQALEFSTQVLRAYIQERVTLDLRARLFLHSQRLSLSHHDLKGTADSLYRIQRDVPDAQSVVVESLFPSIAAVFSLVGMLAVALRIDWQLALAAIAISPGLFLLNQRYRRRFRSRWREVRDLETSAQKVVQEVLGALRVVKAFGQETREHDRFVRSADRGVSARLGLAMGESSFGVYVNLLTVLGTAVVLWLGVRHVREGSLTLGELLLVMGYVTQLYDPLKTLSRLVAGLQGKLSAAERVFTLLDGAPDVVDRPATVPLARARGAIEFHHVSFGYAPDRPVLDDVSFEVPPGSRVGIAGRTGAGKTTLLSLLMRFYDPTIGSISLDGVDIRDYRVRDLRRQYALMLQEPVLFSTSISENIAYARADASRAEIVEAAKSANAHDFIMELPGGYDTLVGERGMTLSGGERQRISLARAFLKNAPILILDEPTSAVDVRTETLMMEALERLMLGRTTLIVAHRLSTIERCDLRLELDHGRLPDVPTAARSVR